MSFYKTEAIKDIFPKENFRLFDRPTPKQSYHSEKLEQLEKIIDLDSNFNNLRMTENKVLPIQSKENIIELETIFFERHREYLMTIYKHFSDIFYDNNFSIFMNYNGFLKFMKDINLVYLNADKICRPSSMKRTKEGGNYLNDKLKSNLFSLNTLNLIFSKFSNETQAPVKRDANLNINIFKKTFTGVYASKESNKKINFKSFIKILLLISNKLFNPKYKAIQIDLQKDFNLDKLLCADSKQMMHYLELLVDNYLKPCYNNIKTFIEKESYDLMLLETILNDSNVDIFFTKMKPSLRKIFLIYTDSREEIYLDEFSKFCHDFEIFPDLCTKSKMYHLFINFVKDFDERFVMEGDPNFSVGFDEFIGIIIYIAVASKLGGSSADELLLFKRILFFFQRMVQAKGLKKTVMATGYSRIIAEFNNNFNKFKSIIDEPRPQITNKSFRELIFKK